MKKPKRIIQTSVTTDYRKDTSFLILTEVDNKNIPIRSYSVELPEWLNKPVKKQLQYRYIQPTLN